MKNREQIVALEGGRFVAEAIEAVEDDVARSPVTVGASRIHSGYGSPEGRVSGQIGDLYLRLDGGATTTLYVKQAATIPQIGWVGK